MKKITLCTLLLLATSSCNIWEPFDGEPDILEAAFQCLHAQNYACAIEKYNLLPDGTLKSQKLCTTYLTKAGISTSILINTMQESTFMMGKLANQLVPWSSTKQADIGQAVTHCTAYRTAVVGTTYEDNGKLLTSLAAITDCSLRMAKSDLFQSTTGADCDTAAAGATSNNGVIERGDISETSDGNLPGMCDADADACRDNLQNVALDLNDAEADISDIPVLGAADVAVVVRNQLLTDQVEP